MIEDRHREFARAVVALAREHRMARLELTFQDSMTPPDRAWPPQRVAASWDEGRHGASSEIHLTAQNTITERDEISP